MQRADGFARREAAIRLPGAGAGIIGDQGDDGVDDTVHCGDPLEVEVEELDRRDLAVAQQSGLLDGRSIADLVEWHGLSKRRMTLVGI
ncbi:hypothetical protein GCM10023147_19880 [Tsukamurella soli]|uniref:Uncharacterized protein n=1 Tax=Tsukamurella soli TaxID=644556 RepID=A0ABP8JI55_9ACTN